jgi:hypothetical protein
MCAEKEMEKKRSVPVPLLLLLHPPLVLPALFFRRAAACFLLPFSFSHIPLVESTKNIQGLFWRKEEREEREEERGREGERERGKREGEEKAYYCCTCFLSLSAVRLPAALPRRKTPVPRYLEKYHGHIRLKGEYRDSVWERQETGKRAKEACLF